MSFEALNHIKTQVARGAVRERAEGNLSLFEYSAQCMFDDMWNKTVMRCRGIVFDTAKGKVVGRPFDKFFNLNERSNTKTKILLHKAKRTGFSATKKLDGSMISFWFYEGKWHCNTPGSMGSPQAQYARDKLLPKYNLERLPQDLSYICELICPWDRKDKVIQYGPIDDLVMIAAFENKWDLVEVPKARVDMLAATAGIGRVEDLPLTVEDFLTHKIPDGEEGYVLRFDDGFRVKIKSAWYTRWHRIVGALTEKNVAELLSTGDYKSFVKDIPESIREGFDDVAAIVITMKEQIEKEVDQWWAQTKDPTNYKECAELFKQAGPIQAILFGRMRNNPDAEQKALWKIIQERLKVGP